MYEKIYDKDVVNSDNLGNEKIFSDLSYNRSKLMKKKPVIV
jgi:hypothetical protein